MFEFLWGVIPQLFLALIVGIMISSCFFIVKGKEGAVLETLGKPHRKARFAGLHLKLPSPITQVVSRVNMQLVSLEFELEVKTSDDAFVTLPIFAQVKVLQSDTGPIRAHYELDNPEGQMKNFLANIIRYEATKLLMNELFKNRKDIQDCVITQLQEKFATYGYEIDSIQIDEPVPSEEVVEAYNLVIASKQKVVAETNFAEAEKIRLVGIAQGQKESKKLQGQGWAAMREAIAKNAKDSMEDLMSTGLSAQDAILLINEINRLDTISSVGESGNLILMDLSASSQDIGKIISSVMLSEKGGQATKPDNAAGQIGERQSTT
ncbi:hypothetical protein ABCL16_003357 [Vibrio parahaemolyticus]